MLRRKRSCGNLSLPGCQPSTYNNRVTDTLPHNQSPSLENLRSLLIIRSIALLGQIGVLCYVLVSSRTTEDLWGMTASLAALGLLTMAKHGGDDAVFGAFVLDRASHEIRSLMARATVLASGGIGSTGGMVKVA